jgi:LEA14-like dessication related protein
MVDMETKLRWGAGAMLALLLGALATGCGRAVQEPEVRITGVRLGAMGLEGGLLQVQLNITNPNRFTVQATRLAYELELAEPGTSGAEPTWIELANDTIWRELIIGGRDSTVVELPVRFTYRGVGGAFRSLLSTGTFDYRVRGSVALEKPVRREVPFRRLGTMSLTGE